MLPKAKCSVQNRLPCCFTHDLSATMMRMLTGLQSSVQTTIYLSMLERPVIWLLALGDVKGISYCTSLAAHHMWWCYVAEVVRVVVSELKQHAVEYKTWGKRQKTNRKNIFFTYFPLLLAWLCKWVQVCVIGRMVNVKVIVMAVGCCSPWPYDHTGGSSNLRVP